MERLTPEEAYAISPAFTGNNAQKPPEAIAHLVPQAKEKTARLTELYDGTKPFHTYYLCSLRTLEDFKTAEQNARTLETRLGASICNYKLVYPGGVAAPEGYGGEKNSNDGKGRFERKMLARSLSGFMDLGSMETWGKIMEAAMLRLFYNKPVVIYTRDTRLFNMLRDVHPLRVIGTEYQGLGFHITRHFGEGAECLLAELTDMVKTNVQKMPAGENHYCKNCGSLLRMWRPLT